MTSQRKAGVILSYVSIFLNSIIQILYTPFLVGMLGQSEYGLYSLVASIIGYLTVLDLGFGNALIVYTSKYHEKGEYGKEQKLHGMFRLVYTIIGIIAMLIAVLIYIFASDIFSSSMATEEIDKLRVMLLILAFNLFITFVFSIYSSIITAYEKFTFQKIVSILNSLLRPILMIPLLFMGFKSITMTIVITIINIAVLVSNYLYCKNKIKVKVRYSGFDKTIFKTVLGYSIWIFLTNIVDKINWSADQAILGIVCGTVSVSVYSIATTFNQLFINLSTAISGVMLPKISKMVAKNAAIGQLSSEFIKVGRMQYYIISLMLSGFIIFGRQFIRLWVGNDFDESYYITILLIAPLSIPLIQNLGLSIMQAMDKYKFRAISTITMSVANIIISIFLARTYGAVGAAIGTSVSLVVCNIILMNIYYYKVIKLDIMQFWKEILWITAKNALFLVTSYFVILNIRLESWLSLIIAITIYTFGYLTYSYVLCMNKYEHDVIKKIMKKLLRK